MAFYIKQGDTSPNLNAVLKDGNGQVIDLTGATITFRMSPINSETLTVNKLASIASAQDGSVTYGWQSSDTSAVGSYYAEFEVLAANGTVETFPNKGYVRIEITDDLG